jgi:F-type H+-transporting ATPase subunit gamma
VETLEDLRVKLDTAEDLRSVVKTMKALAAISIRHFQEAVDSLGDYHRTVGLGLQVALRHRPEHITLAERVEIGRVAAVVVGSDQGMCGQFNEEIAAHAARELEKMGVAGKDRIALAVGLRVTPPLAEVGIVPDDVLSISASLSGLTPLVQDILLQIDQWYAAHEVRRIVMFHSQPTSQSSYSPHTRQLLPADPRWLQALQERAWESRRLPMFTVDWSTLFSSLIRQHLLVSVYRSVVESLAAENASRMASMQAAERNIDERIHDLRKRFHQQRQSSITAELLDIVGGFEALGGEAP